MGHEHRSALFYSPVAHGRLTEKGLNALIDSFSSSVPERQKIRSIYSNTSYIYPSDLGGLSPEYWEAMRLEPRRKMPPAYCEPVRKAMVRNLSTVNPG